MLRSVADCTNTVADQGTALEIRRTTVAATRSRGGILPALAVPAHLLVLDVGCMFAALDIATLRTVPDYFRSGSAGRMGYSDHSSLAAAADAAAATADTARLDSLTSCRLSEHSDLLTATLRSRRCYGCSTRHSPACRLGSMASRNPHEAKRWYSITKSSQSPSKMFRLWHFLFQPQAHRGPRATRVRSLPLAGSVDAWRVTLEEGSALRGAVRKSRNWERVSDYQLFERVNGVDYEQREARCCQC